MELLVRRTKGLAVTLIERSYAASENGEVWTREDHARLRCHLKDIDRLAERVREKAQSESMEEAELRRMVTAEEQAGMSSAAKPRRRTPRAEPAIKRRADWMAEWAGAEEA
jgi:hypothetical protein